MAYFTNDYDTLKEAVVGALPYSADLTAATATAITTMGGDYISLDDPEWYQSFIPIYTLYCIETAPAPMWGITGRAGDIIFLKRGVQIARFTLLSSTEWRVTLPDLNIADWTKHQ